MPTYSYTCDHCEQYSSERTHSMSDTPEYKCPVCGNYLRKVYSAPALGSKAIPTRKLPA